MGILSSIPSTLNRWAEESRVLDGDSIHDCVTGILVFFVVTILNIIKRLIRYKS